MKRTGIIALAAGCAMGVTALVGGVGYASALDVAEQTGRTLDVSGVSTVGESSSTLADSPELDPSAEPTDDATADGTAGDDTTTDPSTDDDGTADQGSGDAVDEVDPSDPVVIGDEIAGKVGKDCGDRAAWFGAHKGDKTGEGAGGDAASDPAKNWSGEHGSGENWSGKGDDSGSWSGEDGSGSRGSGDKGSGWGKGNGDGGHRGGGGGGWGGGRH